ncbi:MAG TPA: type II toxin-antitoxin system RelE/ParE family toxin [Gammaproteobacteria bacterium]|nr:type II toxin-antitoxin system RelE/ParE family toxin [Gammaproteobacteria bacterium]
MSWSVEILDHRVEKELKKLPADMQARFLHVAELLEEFGPEGVGMPHVRPLESKLYEIRLKGKAGIGRAIYIGAKGNRLVVLHVFQKKTRAAPRQAIDLAKERSKEIDDG